MGAGWSAATGLHVQCDKAEYVAGDTVRAIVALNVVKPIELESVELQVCEHAMQCPLPLGKGCMRRNQQRLRTGGPQLPASQLLHTGKQIWGREGTLPPCSAPVQLVGSEHTLYGGK